MKGLGRAKEGVKILMFYFTLGSQLFMGVFSMSSSEVSNVPMWPAMGNVVTLAVLPGWKLPYELYFRPISP